MDLIPTPEQLVAAAGNVAQSVLQGGLADLRPMPRTLVADGGTSEVHHYVAAQQVAPSGDPVLLVPPLAAPALCYDLRRGCSLVERLVGRGRPTYLVEHGEVPWEDRSLGVEPWVERVVPEAVRAVHEHAGGSGVHVVGWSLGGVFALLAAADRADLPIASLTILGAPVDVTKVPLVAPARPLVDLTQGTGLLTRAWRALTGVPLAGWAASVVSPPEALTRSLVVLRHLDDADRLAQLEAVSRFMAHTTAYPGRTFGQLHHRFARGNALAGGSMEVGGRTVDLAAIEVPVLVVAGTTDTIAPLAAVRAVVPLLAGSREVRLELVPGGHLGMLTGRGARETTWTAIDEWVDRWSVEPPPRTPAKKTAKKTAKRTAKRAPVKKTAAQKPATPPAPTDAAGPAGPLGADPSRRYGSASSRALGPQ